MYCPQCGQLQISNEIRFCSRCGFALGGVVRLIEAGGVLPGFDEEAGEAVRSPRRRGVEQGVILMLVGLALLPLINVAVRPPYNEALLFVFLLGGILRALYALVFQEGKPRKSKQIVVRAEARENKSISSSPQASALVGFNEQAAETAEIIKPSGDLKEKPTKALDERNDAKTLKLSPDE